MKPRHAVAGLVPLAALVLGAATPSAVAADEDSFSFAFTTAKAKSAAGYSMEAEFPTQRIIDQLTITLPRGTKVDTRAVPRCTATSEQAEEQPLSELCPSGSLVGTGKGSAFIADNPTPTTFDLEYYNFGFGAVISILLNGNQAFTSPVRYKGRKQVIDLSLTPDLNARIVSFSLDVDKAGTAKKPLFRTPLTCPKNRKLTASVTAHEDGDGSVTTRDTSRCKR